MGSLTELKNTEKPVLEEEMCLIWDRISDVKHVLRNLDFRTAGGKQGTI